MLKYVYDFSTWLCSTHLYNPYSFETSYQGHLINDDLTIQGDSGLGVKMQDKTS